MKWVFAAFLAFAVVLAPFALPARSARAEELCLVVPIFLDGGGHDGVGVNHNNCPRNLSGLYLTSHSPQVRVQTLYPGFTGTVYDAILFEHGLLSSQDQARLGILPSAALTSAASPPLASAAVAGTGPTIVRPPSTGDGGLVTD